MKKQANYSVLPDGMYPAMVTLYTKEGSVDYNAIKELTKWYVKQGCTGVFAACLSSEILCLSLEERINIIKTVLEYAGDMHVVASGHTADTIEEQISELKEIAKTGVKTIVLITNRLAKEDESEEVMKNNVLRIINSIKDVDFGLYEAPLPFNRIVSADFLKWCAETERFVFFKDTCSCIELLKEKLKAISGTRLKLYNANSPTLLESIKYGAAGISGVMGNFHPALYEKMIKLAKTDYKKAEKIQNLLGFASIVQYQLYPINAKYYLKLEGLPVESLYCRTRKNDMLNESMIDEITQMFNYFKMIENKLDEIETNNQIEIKEYDIFDGNKGFEWQNDIYRLVCGAWIAECENGELLCNWLTGNDKEPSPDNCTAISRSTDGGKTWSVPEMLVEPGVDPGSSWIFGCKDKVVALNARWPLEDQYTIWHYTRSESFDNGKTFNEAVPISFTNDENISASFSQPIVTQDGRVLFSGTTFEKRKQIPLAGVERLAFAKTEEEAINMKPICKGETNPYVFARVKIGSAVFETDESFSKIKMLGGVTNRPLGLLEPALVELSDGTLVMLMRAEWGGFLWRSESKDGGKTWCDAYQTDIPNPTSMAKLIRVPDGRIVLIHNNVGGVVGKRPPYRDPLSIWVSDDDMKTWYIKQDIHKGGNSAYPHPLILKDGRIVFVYDYNRRQAKFVELILPEPRG